ncbi:hypothetical protein [Streptomyces mirabilis]|uniref:hypothetical protein n=1 Tax=Streptomyces mirabilis TaxID=68239 RepID=UPI0036A1FC36
MVDVSGPDGVARVGKGSGGGWVWTCAYGTLDNDGESMPPFTLHGVDGAKPGDSGTVTYTASADNTASVTGTTRMTAQSGLVLAARPRNCSYNPTFTDAWCTVPAQAAPHTARAWDSNRAMSQEAGPPRLRGCSHRRPQRSTAWTRD